MTLSAFIIPPPGWDAEASADNVTNHYTTPSSGIIRDTGYQNAGDTTAIQAFVTSGLVPITAAMVANGFVIACGGAAPNWLFNAARINFYSAATPTIPNLVSSVTAGITLAADARSIICPAGSIPGAATHFGTNMKWAQGIPSLVYASTNVIPTGADVSLASDIMVNSGIVAACLTTYGASGTSETITAAPTLAANQFIVCREGYTTYLRKPWQSGKHMVSRVATSPESHDYNNCFQFTSVVQVTSTGPSPFTPGAFSANYSVTGASADTFAVQSDDHPAYKINGMFLGGAHGVPSSLITSVAHGKTNVDRGSIWSTGGTNYMMTEIYDANRLFLTALNTGTATAWAISSTTLTSGTMAHVSGATNTASFVIASGVLAYLMPATDITYNQVWLEGGGALSTDGVFTAIQHIQEFDYQVPNAASVLDYVAANVGSAGDLQYNAAGITKQLRVRARWVDDAWSSMVRYEVTALQDHLCSFSWPTQWQPINARSSASETLWFCIPGTITNAASAGGVPAAHNDGSPLNFSAFVNINSNTKEYYQDSTVWAAASYWADGVQRAPLVEAFGVKNSSGAWLRKYVMARSRIAGWTADNDPDVAHFLSGSNKAYAATRYNENVVAGDARAMIAGYGWIDPAFDTHADINFAFPLGGGMYEFNWWTNETLTDYSVPIRADLVDKQITIICNSASCAFTTGARTVTTTGPGGLTALLY